MIHSVKFGDFKFPENTYAFSKSAIDIFTKSKNLEWHEKIVESIKRREINAALTPNEIKNLKLYLGEEKYIKNYFPVWKSGEVFYVINIPFNSPHYSELYNLYLNHNIHAGDLSIALVAIEHSLPLITEDYHHWSFQNKFIKVYNERHKEEIAQCLAKKQKRKFFEMYTSKDFCTLKLKSKG